MSVGKQVSVEARVRKAVSGLRMAAKTKGIFHLWTHPFYLGVDTEELLRGLDRILDEARRLADAGEIEITTMGELAAQLEKQRRERLGGTPSRPSENHQVGHGKAGQRQALEHADAAEAPGLFAFDGAAGVEREHP